MNDAPERLLPLNAFPVIRPARCSTSFAASLNKDAAPIQLPSLNQRPAVLELRSRITS
jgi:hypothetical protein